MLLMPTSAQKKDYSPVSTTVEHSLGLNIRGVKLPNQVNIQPVQFSYSVGERLGLWDTGWKHLIWHSQGKGLWTSKSHKTSLLKRTYSYLPSRPSLSPYWELDPSRAGTEKQGLVQEEFAYRTEEVQALANLNQKDHEHMYGFFFYLSTCTHFRFKVLV